MTEEDLYPIIFKRKSIRRYDLSPLEKSTLKEISEMLNTIKPLYNDIQTEIKIINTDDVNRRMMKKAPHYFGVFSETKKGYLTNIGFMMQQVDLRLSARGIGTCWQGIPVPKKEILKSSNLKFVILMAFGYPTEPLHRDLSGFKRKSIDKIAEIEDADEILEAARLAPSATNSQPWFFMGDKNLIHAYSVKPSIFKGLVVNKYIPIDMGISLYHLMVASEHFDKSPEIVFDKDVEENSPKGYVYYASLKLNND